MYKVLTLLAAVTIASTGSIEPKGGFGGGGITGTVKPPIHLTSNSFSVSKSSAEPEKVYFECPTYGPFHIGDANFEATFKYRLTCGTMNIIERLRVFSPSGSVLSSTNKAYKKYQADSLETVTFVIPINSCLTKDGMTFKIEILNKQNRAIVQEYGTTIYPVGFDTPSYQELKRDKYTSKPIAFYGDGTSLKSIAETFDFTNIGDYLDIDYYYRINIKDIVIKYDSILNLSYSSINLRFEDHDNLFPYYLHDYFNINLPIKANYDRHGILNLQYKNTIYVNKKTLQMSHIPQSGFTSTKSFYLPVNGKKLFNNKLLYLEFTNFGQCGLNVTFPIRYSADKSLVGLCGDSGYYVEGGVK